MLDKYQRLVLLDFETTGLSYQKDKVIEIGMIVLDRNPLTNKFVVVEEYNRFIKIDFKLDPVIINLTNITDEMLENEGIFESEVADKIYSVLNDKTLFMAYNLQFDVSFLIEMVKNYHRDFEFNFDCLDVMAVYKDRQPYPHRLKDAISFYGVDVENTHRAVDDVKATLEVFKKMILEKNNIDGYVNVLGYNAKYGVSGVKLSHIKYIAQYGGRKEIERLIK
jgi:DNA polymerase III alpha subunit (gram-positive type)